MERLLVNDIYLKVYVNFHTKNSYMSFIHSYICTRSCREQVFELYNRRPVTVRPLRSAYALFQKYPCCLTIVRKTNPRQILGGLMWRQTEFGNKIGTSFAINNAAYQRLVLPQYIYLLKRPGYYAELSGAVGYLVNKHITPIRNPAVISTLLPTVTYDNIIINKDDARFQTMTKIRRKFVPVGSYYRRIAGIGYHWKTLYGRPCIQNAPIGLGCRVRCADAYIEFPLPDENTNNNDSNNESEDDDSNNESEAEAEAEYEVAAVDLSVEAGEMEDGPHAEGGMRGTRRQSKRKGKSKKNKRSSFFIVRV